MSTFDWEAVSLGSLALPNFPGHKLFTVYQGWLDRVAALEAAQIIGVFAPPDSLEQASARRESLDDHARIQRGLTALRAQAEKKNRSNTVWT